MIDVLSGQRPGLPPGVRLPSIIWRLVRACWLEDADARPGAANVLEALNEWIGRNAWAEERAMRPDQLLEGALRAVLPQAPPILRHPNKMYSQDDMDTLENREAMDYDNDLPQFLEEKGTNWESPAFADSIFDARQLWNPSGAGIPSADSMDEVSTPHPSDADFASDTETEAGSSERWSDEDTDWAPTAPHSPFSSALSLPKNVLDEFEEGGVTCRLLPTKAQLKDSAKALSEPVFPFRPPKGSIWNNKQLQNAWSGYMDRRTGSSGPMGW